MSAEDCTANRARKLGGKLRKLRESAGVDADRLAALALIDANFYNEIEAGQPSALEQLCMDEMFRITLALGVRPRELFEGVD